MNWGLRITILYIGFVAMIVTLVILTMRQKVDLVAANYYEQELKYQGRMDDIARADSLADPVDWFVDESTLSLNFPQRFAGRARGTISFFRPSDSAADKQFTLNLNGSGRQQIMLEGMRKGRYKLQLSWIMDGVSYYKEGVVNIK